MSARVYRVEEAGAEVAHLVIANTPAQAVNHVVAWRFKAKPASSLEVARAAAEGRKIADATAKPQADLPQT